MPASIRRAPNRVLTQVEVRTITESGANDSRGKHAARRCCLRYRQPAMVPSPVVQCLISSNQYPLHEEWDEETDRKEDGRGRQDTEEKWTTLARKRDPTLRE